MKILLVTEDIPAKTLGGAGKHAVLLGNALIDAGYEVELLGCTSKSGLEVNNDFSGKLHTLINMNKVGLKEAALGIFNPLRKLVMANRIWKAIQLMPYQQFDVIHYHGHVAELGVLVPKSINFVHTLHDQGSECMTMMRFKDGAPCQSTSSIDCAGCATKIKPNFLQKIISATSVKFHRYLSHKAFTKHKAIFVSEFLLRRFKEVVAGSENINAYVIHNFTNAKAIEFAVKNRQVNQKPNSKPVVLIVGRLHETKGQLAFLNEMPKSLLDKIEVRVAGDGPDFNELKLKFEMYGVKFLGWLSQEDIYIETLQADACVVPSIWEEPCGTVTLEALAMGKVVFSLARGGTPEQSIYTNRMNQLRLFNNISSLVVGVSQLKIENPNHDINFSADVTLRLPEIINIYKT